MNNCISPTVKQLWNYAMHVLHNFGRFNINTTAFCLGKYSLHLFTPKDLHDLVRRTFIICKFSTVLLRQVTLCKMIFTLLWHHPNYLLRLISDCQDLLARCSEWTSSGTTCLGHPIKSKFCPKSCNNCFTTF